MHNLNRYRKPLQRKGYSCSITKIDSEHNLNRNSKNSVISMLCGIFHLEQYERGAFDVSKEVFAAN